MTCDVINCNGCRPLEHLTCAGGRESFKTKPNELDSVHQAREKFQKNHEALTRNLNENHLYLTLRSSGFSLVCYTAVFSVVTQRSSGEERCVTTLKTAL